MKSVVTSSSSCEKRGVEAAPPRSIFTVHLGQPERRGDISGLRGIYMYAKAIGFVGVLLVLAACSSTPEAPPAGPAAGSQNLGPAGGLGSRNIVPGSQQDLEASAGDRIFFAFD